MKVKGDRFSLVLLCWPCFSSCFDLTSLTEFLSKLQQCKSKFHFPQECLFLLLTDSSHLKRIFWPVGLILFFFSLFNHNLKCIKRKVHKIWNGKQSNPVSSLKIGHYFTAHSLLTKSSPRHRMLYYGNMFLQAVMIRRWFHPEFTDNETFCQKRWHPWRTWTLHQSFVSNPPSC